MAELDPSEVRFLASSPMAELVDRLVAHHKPEVIVVGDPALTQYVEKHDASATSAGLHVRRHPRLQAAWGSELRSRQVGERAAGKEVRPILSRISRHYDHCISSSQEDRDSIATAWPSETTDRHHSRWTGAGSLSSEPRRTGSRPDDLSGRDLVRAQPYAVNWFATEILPGFGLGSATPSSGSPVAAYKDGSEPKADGVHYTGYVEDVRVAIASGMGDRGSAARRGRWLTFEVAESMALGTPLVSTAIGYEGVAVEDRTHLLAAESSERFAECCIELLGDPQLRARLSMHARQLLEARYDWRKNRAGLRSDPDEARRTPTPAGIDRRE